MEIASCALVKIVPMKSRCHFWKHIRYTLQLCINCVQRTRKWKTSRKAKPQSYNHFIGQLPVCSFSLVNIRCVHFHWSITGVISIPFPYKALNYKNKTLDGDARFPQVERAYGETFHTYSIRNKLSKCTANEQVFHMETLLIQVKACKWRPMYGTHGQ